MGDEAQSEAGGTGLATEAPKLGEPAVTVQPGISTDGKLADILAKKSRGEKLTMSEIGYLGGIRRKKQQTIPVAFAASPAASSPVKPVAESENPLLKPTAQAQASVAGAAVPPVDSGLLRRTANAFLNSMDTVTKWFIGREVKAAGGDKITIEKYKEAVTLQPENRSLIVENSEPAVIALCATLHCTPEKLKGILEGSGLAAGFAAHAFSVVAALKQIREDRAEREARLVKPPPNNN